MRAARTARKLTLTASALHRTQLTATVTPSAIRSSSSASSSSSIVTPATRPFSLSVRRCFSTDASKKDSDSTPNLSSADLDSLLREVQDGSGEDGKPLDMEALAAKMKEMGINMEAPTQTSGTGEEGAEFSTSESQTSSSPTPSKPVLEVKAKGAAEKLNFQAETRQLLDIVTHSIYTDHEVFLRELISNASDALEKLRYTRTSGDAGAETIAKDTALQIQINAHADEGILVITDTGIGMTREEMQENLGVIARSGSKAFVKDVLSGSKDSASNIIGQFGVGFYSVFMVASKVEVISQSARKDPSTGNAYAPHMWSSDGTGTYELSEIEPSSSLPVSGTSIKIYLKPEFKDFASSERIQEVVNKYSNFVAFPIELNGQKLNTIGAIWLESKDSVSHEQHLAFYRFIAPGMYDTPTYNLHFHVDAPLALHGLFYFPERHQEKYGMGRMEPGVSLYSRKVLIEGKSKKLLPEWLRFVRGVADSEDIPLNLSRESMQNSALLDKIGNILTRKILKFLEEEAKKDAKKYDKWYAEFGGFLKEGVCTEYRLASNIAALLRFESSATKDGERISLDDYLARMPPQQKSIYYLSTPSRQLAQSSPYYESFAAKNVEVLFLYENIDEFVMSSLGQYNKRNLVSIEKAEAGEDIAKMDDSADQSEEAKKKKEEAKKVAESRDTAELIAYMQTVLSDRCSSIRATTRLTHSPAAIFDHESAAVRRLMKFVDSQGTSGKGLPKQKLEVNPSHPIMKHLMTVKRSNPALASMIVEQIFDNCLIAADMLDQPRAMLERINKMMQETVTVVGGNTTSTKTETVTEGTQTQSEDKTDQSTSSGVTQEAEIVQEKASA